MYFNLAFREILRGADNRKIDFKLSFKTKSELKIQSN